MRVGEVEIVPLLDAVGKLGELAELYPDVPAEAWDPYRELYPTQFEDSRWRFNVSVQLVRVDGQTILVDTGYGPSGWWKHWAPERDGLLPGALEEVGVGREDVDVVFLTHLHVDHIGWNTDEDGSRSSRAPATWCIPTGSRTRSRSPTGRRCSGASSRSRSASSGPATTLSSHRASRFECCPVTTRGMRA